MKRIVIAGCGGFGQEVYEYLSQDIKNDILIDVELIGVIDDFEELFKSSGIDLPFLGSISSYKFDNETFAIVCVGDVKSRVQLTDKILHNGGKLYTYIHSSCYIADSSCISDGVIVCPQSIINANAVIDRSVVINVCSSVGHGAHIGKNSTISPYCAVNGDARVGESCFLGTRATVYPKISLADNSVVDAHSAVKKTVVEPSIISNRAKYICVPNRFF